MNCRHKNSTLLLDFHIMDTSAPPVLAMKACRDLNLVKIVMAVSEGKDKIDTDCQNIIEDNADVFQGIGEFPGKCNFRVDPDVAPVVCPPRKIPTALRSRLKDELDSMEKNGVISKVTEPTDWVNALVVVESPKTGKLRVCLDSRPLNKAIKASLPATYLGGRHHKACWSKILQRFRC